MGSMGIGIDRDPLIVPPDTRPRAGREERLEALWKQMLSQDFSNADLIKVIHYVPFLAYKAWGELLKRRPSNSCLLGCITWNGQDYISAEAGMLLIDGTFTGGDLVRLVRTSSTASERAMEKLKRLFDVGMASNEEMRGIVEHRDGWTPDNKFREQAARMLLMLSPPSKADLVCIMQNCDEVLAKQAWRKFCMQYPNKQEVCSVLKEVRQDYIVKMALRRLLMDTPTNDELVLVISTTKNNRQASTALATFLHQEPTKNQLRQLIGQAPDVITAQVWPRFLECLPSEEELLSVITSYQFVEEAASEILRRPDPSKKALRIIIEFSNTYSEPAARLLLQRKPTAEDLRLIAFHVNDLQSEVQKRMPPRSAAEIVEQMRSI